ncbi:MAG: Trm112 family protein [Gemmatimonadales bacterium]
MHLELTELLCCPRCGPPHGLIAFVERMEARRIVAGRLDCPMCEARHPIRDGIVWLDEATAEAETQPEPGPERRTRPSMPAESASIAAALLGAPGDPEILLFAGAASGLGPDVAEHRPEAVLVAWGPPPEDRHSRVHPVVPPGPGAVPQLRPGRLDGAVISARDGSLAAAIAPALKSGGRLVALGPGFTPPADAGFEELASDSRAWVGVRR